MTRQLRLKALLAVGAIALSSTAFAHRNHVDDATIAARIRIFGAENVNPRSGEVQRDKVVMSWLTHTTMATAIQGRVILLDTFIARLETKRARTPFVIQDVVDLKPEAIFIGHGHGDHADNTAYIAAKTGATIYASQETCATLQLDLARMKADSFMNADPQFALSAATTISCVDVTTTNSTPGTQIVTLDALEPQACVIGFRHLHSVVVPTDPDWSVPPVVDTPDPRDAVLFPPGDPLTPSVPRRPGQQNIRTIGNPGGAISIWFHFVLRNGSNFTIAFNNTAGALKEGKGSAWLNGVPADGQRIVDILRSLPPTDLHFGTASSANTDFNGWRDHVYYLEALRPKIFMPSHAPVGASLQYFSGFMRQINLMEQPKGTWPGFPREDWPSIRWLTDPSDTLKPMVFDVNDNAWESRGKHRRIAQFCGGRKGHHDKDD